ncbi:unnamed protein product [Caenorhabditis sp. 36 PRJEB53466]|nr:unnamed protein product [Caenorhabditis sp. 36 PRJEB53466]
MILTRNLRFFTENLLKTGRISIFRQMSSSSEPSSEDEQTKQVKEETQKKEKQKKEKKSKKRQSEADAEVAEPQKKKVKKEEVTGRLKDNDGNEMFEFGNLRYASVTNYKGKEYLNIREYYVDKNSGKVMPSRKGISITKGQWANLKDLIPEIDKKLA